MDSEEPYVDVGSERIMVDQVGGHIAGYLRQRQIRESIRESWYLSRIDSQ